jgi:hypothetical protein
LLERHGGVRATSARAAQAQLDRLAFNRHHVHIAAVRLQHAAEFFQFGLDLFRHCSLLFK